jgi:SAM-dependent MidA family methyltransferase
MKNILSVVGLCLILCGCGEDAPPSKSSSYTPPVYNKNEPAVVAPPQTSAAQTAQPAPASAKSPEKDTKGTAMQRPATQILNDAAAVVDYGTGAAPLTAKKKMTDKIQAIQNQQNQNMKKNLNGN